MVEAGLVAGNDGAGRGQCGEMLTHLRKGYTGLRREFGVKALTMFLEAIQDFGQGEHRWMGAGTLPDQRPASSGT